MVIRRNFMELKMFNFIEKSGEYLENSKERLEAACKDIELYFQEILLLNNDL